jgi:hypothetical protein
LPDAIGFQEIEYIDGLTHEERFVHILFAGIE